MISKLMEHIQKAFSDAKKVLNEFVEDTKNLKKIKDLGNIIVKTFQQGGKVIIFGNGGSSCDAAHFAEEFTGRYRKERKPLPVMVINEPSHLTCVGNDYGFDQVFLRSVEAFLKPGDVTIGISTSGNSQNVIAALDYAQSHAGITCALLGKNGGKMCGKYDHEWIVNAATSDRIQEVHMTILHILIEVIERKMFPQNYR